MNKPDFETLYKTYQDRIYRLCLGYFGGNDQLAKDTCQDIFIKVWQNLDRFKGESKASTWMFRIAVNTCINVLRKSKNKQENHQIKEEIIADETSLNSEHQLRIMYKCINQLKPTDRTIILLVLDKEPYEDIASIMGVSENNLRVKIHRIKNKLSKCVTS